ncbi:MAG: PAS domain S-box protein [Oscillatoria sp. SIO1A7]|nr:PAS domain S-box protein [Oscillatoria sp. SIO1A7]
MHIERLNRLRRNSSSDYLSNESELETSLALLRATLESTADGIMAVDLSGRITHFNRKFLEMWAIPERLVSGGDCGTVMAFFLDQLQDPEKISLDIQELLAGVDAEYSNTWELKPGSHRAFECHSFPSIIGEQIVGRVWTFSDITKKREYEKRLNDSLEELSDLKFALEQSAILVITDDRGRIIDINDKFCKLSQYSREELIGKTHRVVNSGYHKQEFFETLWRQISKGEVWKGEIKNKAKDGSYYWVDTTIIPFVDSKRKPFQYLAIRFDVTNRKLIEEALRGSREKLKEQTEELQEALENLKRTQAQLVQSEKIFVLGEIVAGLAHEINNPVSFIYGNILHADAYIEELLHLIKLYQKHYPNPVDEIAEETDKLDLEFLMEDLPKLLRSMTAGAERIREMISSLRNFARLDESDKKRVDIHAGINSTLLLLQHRLHNPVKAGQQAQAGKEEYAEEIRVIKDYGNLPIVECYPSELNQVFMNILSNAIDVLATQPPPRTIAISTRVRNSLLVEIIIFDNGPGISEEVQKRIFDPFFTTKPVGSGTGLGLTMSYQIVVEKHGGSLRCLSTPGCGTEFAIAIPISPQ